MAVETIREFLVALGYKQDEAALRKFEDGITKATKAVVTLATAVEATALTVAFGIQRFASNLEALYYASVRTGSSATQLQALDRWAQNFGASAGEALASVEGLAHALRMNEPGVVAFLEGVGIHVKHLKDGTVDASDALIQLAQFFKRSPMLVAERYASILGINENTMLALRRGDLADIARILKEIGPGMDQSADAAHRFEVQLRGLQNQLEGIKVRVLSGIFTALKPQLEELESWINTHQAQIQEFVVASVTFIKTAAIDTALAIRALVREYEKLVGVGTKIGEFLAKHAPRKFQDTLADSINEDLYSLGFISEEDYERGRAYYESEYGAKNSNPGNLEFHGQPGATRATGGRFARFASQQEGLDALARQLELYAKRGLTSVQAIVSKYAPPTDKNDTTGYIENVRKALGVKATDTLNLGDPKVLATLMSAIVRQEGNGAGISPEAIQMAALSATRGYKPGTFADTRFGQWLESMANASEARQAATFNQDIDIHIDGSGDPRAVAARVAELQKRTNDDVLRNAGLAVVR